MSKEENIQKAKEVREGWLELARDYIDATHIEVGQIEAKDDVKALLSVRVSDANRFVPYGGHDTSEFTVGDYWAVNFDDLGIVRLAWWVSNAGGGGVAPTTPHKDTHDPQTGTDPLDCGAPTTILATDTAPAESIADEFARSEHVHGIDVGVPANIGNANVEGTSEEFVRRDHEHNHPAGLGTDLHHALIHTHAGAGTGGQLDWDDIWSDAVHDHSDDAEGGLLTWMTHIHAFKENKSGECDGVKVVFITANEFEPYTLQVLLNGQEQVDGAANDYLEGALYDSFTMAVAPVGGDTLIMHYLAAS